MIRLLWLIAACVLRVYGSDGPYILVVGGAGFVGSNVNELLYRSGYRTIVLDNLSRGDRRTVLHGMFIEGDLANRQLLDQIFTQYPIALVMDFAGFMNVGESVSNPLLYYTNNVSGTLNLLDVMERHKVDKFIFSSSCTVFGKGESECVGEDHPRCPINPYGRSKLMIEWALEDLERACGLKYCILRYFNAAGGDPEGVIKTYKLNDETLISTVLRNFVNPEEKVFIFGTSYPTLDGTCIRDYIHVDDLGRAHVAAMEKLLSEGVSCVYNLGSGRGYSVREVIAAAECVLGKKAAVVEGLPRLGDVPFIVADCAKAWKELHWEPRWSSLETMIAHAWEAMEFLRFTNPVLKNEE